MEPAHENLITVLGRDLLLVDVGGGAETHLASIATGCGRSVEFDRDTFEPLVGRWDSSTLCGRTWNHMAAGADELLPLWRDPAFAPTCRACLKSLDSWFPAADTPAGVQLLAAVVAEEVIQRSSAYVVDVPVEHVEATRAAIRGVLRSAGYRSRTAIVEGVLHVWSDDAYQALDRDEIRQSVTGAIERIMTPDPLELAEEPVASGRIDWHTWVLDA